MIDRAPTNNDDLILQIPFSELAKFDTTGTIKELGKAPEVTEKAGIKPVQRFVISTVGIFFLMIGLIGVFGGNPNLLSFACLIAGGAIIWFFLAKGEMEKRKQAEESKTKKDMDISLTFTRQGIVMRSPHKELKKEWAELAEYRKTKKGIYLNFKDGSVGWLPENAFYGDEMKSLSDLLKVNSKE